MKNQESKRHHYTPEFIMENWVVTNSTGHKHLIAYYWDKYCRCIRHKSDKGPKSFCHQNNLLTLVSQHPAGKDVIEHRFFGEIDLKGASVFGTLQRSEGKVTHLTADHRRDWARLLISLDARRPDTVSKLKNHSATLIREELNNDQKFLDYLTDQKNASTPVEYIEENHAPIEDFAALNIQSFVDNATVGKILINAHWHIIQLNENAEPLILSDRPLIRYNAHDSLEAVWILPVTPSKVFIAMNHPISLQRILSIGHRQLSKKLNVSSTLQADKYVFSADGLNHLWLEKYIKRQED